MKTIAKGKGWKQVQEAIKNGKFARHANWTAPNVQTPAGQYSGPIAMGYVGIAGAAGADTIGVFTDTGHRLHDWHATAPEFESKEWEIVELVNHPGDVARAAAVAARDAEIAAAARDAEQAAARAAEVAASKASEQQELPPIDEVLEARKSDSKPAGDE